MICPTCSWPMVTQEAKAGFLYSSCLSGKCARVCYIPLSEKPKFHVEPTAMKQWPKLTKSPVLLITSDSSVGDAIYETLAGRPHMKDKMLKKHIKQKKKLIASIRKHGEKADIIGVQSI